MKKFLLVIAVLIVQSAFSQIISKDNTFAVNGIYSIPSTVSGIPSDFSSYWSRMIQNQDGSIYFTYNKENLSGGLSEPVVLSKISSSGITDITFGNNGEAIANFNSLNSHLHKQSDGKLIIIGFNSGANIVRFLPNGQLDSSFGNNGISQIPNLGADTDLNNYGLFFQNNKIIVYGRQIDNDGMFLPYRAIYRLNENGSIDSTFGSNGFINTQGKFVFLDGQNNIISLTAEYPSNSKMEKYDSNGQPIISYGTNGVKDLTFSLITLGTAIIDSNDNIVYSTMDGEIGKINSNGTLDSTFVFDPNSLPFPIWVFNITEKNGFYYIGGVNQTSNKYFISRLTQNGTIDTNFNYFVESNMNLTQIGDMVINDSNLIVNGGGYIVKYLLNNPTLSVVDNIEPKNYILFDNPIKENLVYKTKEKLDRIEIYSMAGDLVRVLKGNNRSVVDLLKGTYIVKVIFEGGKTTSKKLIKN